MIAFNSEQVNTCPFCDIYKDPAKLINRLSEACSFTPLNPTTLGHVLVVPRRHVSCLADLNDREAGQLLRLAYSSSHERSFYVIQQNGPLAQQTVPHLHFHVVPKREGDTFRIPWNEES